MKIKLLASLTLSAVLLSLSGNTFAQDTATAFKPPAQPGYISEQDIANLKQSYTNEQTKHTFQWQGAFTKVEKAKKTTLAKSAQPDTKTPYRITGALYEVKEVRGKKTYQRKSNGTCWYIIKDDAGKVLTRGSQPLSKMCPS